MDGVCIILDARLHLPRQRIPLRKKDFLQGARIRLDIGGGVNHKGDGQGNDEVGAYCESEGVPLC